MLDKIELRRALKARASALTTQYREQADRAICEAVLGTAQWREAGSVFIYVSMWAEPETRPLLNAAFAEGKRVYVPLCCPDRVLEAVRIEGLDELRPGLLNIPEPVDISEKAVPGALDLAIVPCVSASANGRRLGHGAGYYDRFLRRFACPTICLCHESLLSEEIPMDEHDIWMDAVATEKQIYSRR